MKPLSVRLFGPFEAKYNGVPLRFSTAKLRALFAYLLLEQESAHGRDALAGLLWESFEPKKARTNLRLSISRLRKSLGPFLEQLSPEQPLLTVDRRQVQLHPLPDEILQVDALQLDRTWASCEKHPHQSLLRCYDCMEKLREAVGLYQGEFLVDMGVDDTEAFSTWRTALQEQYHIRVLELIDVLTEYALQIGHWRDALELAHRRLQWEPWSERAFQQLMKSLAGMGDRAGVTQQYQRCCEVLEEELGASPSPETTALYERLLEQGSPLPRGALDQVHLRPQRLSFVGREKELLQIRALLLDPLYRLVSLVGAGGCGKTRLASAAAQSLGAHFADGVWLVPLDGIQGEQESLETALIEAIAFALGCPLRGTTPPHEQVARFLEDKELLLLLDNFEPLLSTAPLLLSLMERAPELRLLVTSRERLEMPGEQAILLEGLPVPPRQEDDPEKLRDYDGAELFLERAALHPEALELTPEVCRDVSWLCHLLRGIPLALELAASWLGTMSLAEVCSSLQQGAGLSQERWLDIPPRHRSMEAVFTTSWELLTEEERSQLLPLAVFRGPFTPLAASAIAGASPQTLDALLAKSLLQQESAQRWSLHPLLRSFLWDRQDEASRHDLEAAHARYFLGWLQDAKHALFDDRGAELCQQLHRCLHDLYAAWSWAIEHEELALLSGALGALARFFQLQCLFVDATRLLQQAIDGLGGLHQGQQPETHELLVRLHTHLIRFFEMMGRIADSAAQGEIVMEAFDAHPLPPLAQAEAHHALGLYLRKQGKLDEAKEHQLRAVALATESDGLPTQASAIYGLSILAFMSGDKDEAEARAKEALSMFQELGMVMDQGGAYNVLGLLAGSKGDREGYKQHCTQALELYQRIDYAFGLKVIYCNLGIWHEQNGEYEVAESLFQKTLLADRRLGDRVCQVITEGNLASTYIRSGNYEEADALLSKTLLLAREIGDANGELWAKLRMGWCHREQGMWEEAHEQLSAALDQAEALGNAMAKAESHFHLGHCHRQRGQLEQAMEHLLAAMEGHQKLSRDEAAREDALGLAMCEMLAGHPDKALERLEAIWPQLPTQIHKGVHRPVDAYLIAHDIFALHQDPRSHEALAAAQRYLTQEMEKIQSQEGKQIFAAEIPSHRRLLQLAGQD